MRVAASPRRKGGAESYYDLYDNLKHFSGSSGSVTESDTATAEQPAEAVRSRRRSRRARPLRRVLVAAAVVVLVPFLFALGSRLGKDPRLVASPLLGKPAPRFVLPRIDTAGELSSSDLSGRVYVVNFWASWCVPCREETPVLEDFYQRWRPRGVELVGILNNDEVDAARQFRSEFGGTWPLVDDPDGRAAIDHGVFGVPETFVIDERGVVMAKLVGAVAPGTLDEILAALATGGEPVYSENDRYRRSP
jgi:cytochrome c biogenesis protein CcmG/thiol:disulfide interchange protein DsbE